MIHSIRMALLAIHVITGTAAVLIGFAALVVPKLGSASPRHRRFGRRFVLCMMFVIGSAIGLTALAFDVYFAGLTVSALVAVFSGVRVLGRKRPDLRAEDRATPLDWIVTLLILATGTALATAAAMGFVARNRPVVYAMAAGTCLYAAYDLYRFMRPTGFPFGPNLWLYEHLVKMLGAYFGTVAAFSGSVLVLLPPPWRQLWATSLGQALAIILVIRYYRIMNSRRMQTRHDPGLAPTT